MTTFIFVRHGESETNRTKKFAGQANPSLTEKGLRQAEQMAQWLAANYCVDHIYSSDLLRAYQTADAFAKRTGGKVLENAAFREINAYLHPKSVRHLKFDGGAVDSEMVRSITVYLATYVMIFIASVLAISFDGFDLVTNFTAAATTLNNIGPGLEVVGPAGNFSAFSDMSKWVLIFNMLAGRLELFPLLILFHPGLWKEQFARHRNRKRA
jgi:hypothetical protein